MCLLATMADVMVRVSADGGAEEALLVDSRLLERTSKMWKQLSHDLHASGAPPPTVLDLTQLRLPSGCDAAGGMRMFERIMRLGHKLAATAPPPGNAVTVTHLQMVASEGCDMTVVTQMSGGWMRCALPQRTAAAEHVHNEVFQQ